MGWFWNVFQGDARSMDQRKRRAVTKGTSAKIQAFEVGTLRNGSLVLGSEDLSVLKIQGQIDTIRRTRNRERLRMQDEMNELRRRKDCLSAEVDKELNNMLDDSAYEAIVQSVFLDEGLTMAPPGNGLQEAQVLKAIHLAESKEMLRSIFHRQSSDNMVSVYSASSRIRERMSEREAKYLSMIMKRDTLVQEQQALKKTKIRLQTDIISRLRRHPRTKSTREGSPKSKLEDTEKIVESSNNGDRHALSHTSKTGKNDVHVTKKSFVHDLAFDEIRASDRVGQPSAGKTEKEHGRASHTQDTDEDGNSSPMIGTPTDGSKENASYSRHLSTKVQPEQIPDADASAAATATRKSPTATPRPRAPISHRRTAHTTATTWQRNPSQRKLNTDGRSATSPATSGIRRTRVAARSTAASRAAAASSAARRAAGTGLANKTSNIASRRRAGGATPAGRNRGST